MSMAADSVEGRVAGISDDTVEGGERYIWSDVFDRLVAVGHVEEASRSDFQAYFAKLPDSYHQYVDAGKAEYVLIHQNVLAEAKTNRSRPAFHARHLRFEEINNMDTATNSDAPKQGDDAGDALAIRTWTSRRQIHEIVLSSIKKRGLLDKLSTLLSRIGLSIREAHVFSTSDDYSLNAFVVDGWPVEDTMRLNKALEASISRNMVSPIGSESLSVQPFIAEDCLSDMDKTLLDIAENLASGSRGDTLRGTYGGEEVFVKFVSSEDPSQIVSKEFKQEILMLREVDHANIIRLIGSCTKEPQFCMMTEYMSGGSLFDFLKNEHNVLDLPMILKFALDICRGMAYLHQKGIIHRDLKSANLLIDKYQVVKVAHFGLSRYQDQEGVMTAETGTYRWMAPEVMNHQHYGHAADVYSFAIVLWELMTRKDIIANSKMLTIAGHHSSCHQAHF
ncbi:serine/threonine-protein kinase STY8 [Brachypodium distachyon]|uniref:Protein kinase domain-containing protein n=1 Tax=Brachypodium distachyon TaxID=15368 RepID=A0A2K2CQ20_BRADI|nr:serine/threonine-protein kinase STY8 [Brachypodium distachyon]PNT64135.1 hypothetical protein BRADI_4g24830v3 [Brachypodium distachyon]|eukprot:XP_024310653.1 serine/threonine-protein kinase STY8 [Brachypodium distachyon]